MNSSVAYFESHAHYDDGRFGTDRDVLLSELLPSANISRVINVGADMSSSFKSLRLAEKYDYILASVGVHPHSAKDMHDDDLDTLLKLAKNNHVVAIGEIGLDFHYDHSPRDIQRKRFRDQLELAQKANLPVIIHSREADFETYDIIKSSRLRSGVIHCFSGDATLALMYAELGFYIGFGGALTYPKATITVKAAAALPLEYILLETDCPYITPVPFRGKRNDSRNLFYICEKLAEIKGVSHAQVARTTFDNGRRLFSIE